MDAKQWATELKALSEDGKVDVVLNGPECMELAKLLEVEPQGGDNAPAA